MILRFIIALVAVGLLVGGIVGFNMFRDSAIQQYFAGMKPAPVTVSTFKVEPSNWTPGIESLGTVSAGSGVDLTVETTGVVKEVNFSANQRIQGGAVLLQLDDAVQKADLEAAQTQLNLNQIALRRAEQLVKSGAGTQSTLDNARAAYETSQTSVNRLQAVLDQKRLKAPFGGMVGIPRVELGQFIQPGTIVVTLQNLDTMRADFSVPEQQLGSLSIGQQVTFGLDGDAEGFSGKISGIEPQVDSTSRLVSVRASISNPNGKLSPGQFVQVRVELPKEDNVIAIPETALVTSLYGDFVYVVKPKPAEATAAPAEGTAAAPATTEAAAPPADAAAAPELIASQVFVTPGRRSRGVVEVTRGLSAGDEIVSAGQNKLNNNSPVAVDNSIQPALADGAAGK